MPDIEFISDKALNRTVARMVSDTPEYEAIVESQKQKLQSTINAHFAGHPYSEGQFAREIETLKGLADHYIVSYDPAHYALELGFKHYKSGKYHPGHHIWRKFTQ
ncbi:DUF5403 family protein [Corynebacterium minutissimum]|uniref:Uncharacterized protein n=1 Tax=Corynebacterium minutissimum TaxID=38301 RepID=A0A376CWL7_9CORY|nr:DUF5403 family protein [Corynebacterium minutissimum]QRP60676.1 DUF5403 family protein [Corynebacterium minutissimum]STC76780.1 Uncharacterised protein [Corynebacterium minutissimum]